MAWTDERVERLSAMWLEGRSASQIATELGGGVSRNAVIGKVHRLGLSGRAVPPAAEAPRPREVEPCGPAEPAPRGPELAVHAADDVAAVLATPAEPIALSLSAIRAARDVGLPASDRVTILELSGSMCRWPIGDPSSAEFRFCGCRASGVLPYCAEHARVAFQPVTDRRRTDRLIRIA